MKTASVQDATDQKNKSMKKIINISDGTQKGKTTAVLKETETCTEFVNINLVYEYNVVLEDVLQKAKQFNISCATIDAKEIAKYRFEDRLLKKYPNITFIFNKLERNTEGAAETILLSLENLNLIIEKYIKQR